MWKGVNRRMYTLNDFFCGCGGIGLGFKNAGFEIVGSWDFDKYAVETYRRNVHEGVLQADITKMNIADIPYADVWAFGFPCQDLSVAGNQEGMVVECSDCGNVWQLKAEVQKCPTCGSDSFRAKNRSGLFFEIMRLLEEAEGCNKKPLILMAENVKALRPYLPVLEEQYKKHGYRTYYTLLNSKWWNVPQNRERYFVIGVREDLEGDFVFPEEQHEHIPLLSTVIDSVVEEKFFVADEKAKTVIEQAKQRLSELGTVHATITPDRIDKRQNGRRAKENEEPMFTLTAQDLHGVIIDDTYGYDGTRVYPDVAPTLRSSRQGLKVVERERA